MSHSLRKKKHFFYPLWILFLSSRTLLAHSQIETWQSIEKLRPLSQSIAQKKLEKTTLLVLDIDMTLLQPQHPALYYANLKQNGKTYQEILGPLSKEKKDELLMNAISESDSKPVEEKTLATIQEIQAKGIKTIALTASFTGKIGPHPRFEVFRFNQLRALGFDFARTFPKQTELTFNQLPAYRGFYPVFYQGVLASNGEKGSTSKGQTLIAFLKTIQWTPKKIIFIDDRKENVEEVATTLEKTFPIIDFLGVEYQGALVQKTPPISSDDFRTFWEERVKKLLL